MCHLSLINNELYMNTKLTRTQKKQQLLNHYPLVLYCFPKEPLFDIIIALASLPQ